MKAQQKQLHGMILDMDGVLWQDTHPIGDLPVLFRQMSDLGLRVILATNNSTRTVGEYQDKVRSFGVELEAWQIVNSSMATVHYLKSQFPQGGPVYVFGEKALIDTLDEAGFFYEETQPLAVVAGMDRSATYEKLRRATLLIRSGLPFIATNPDRTFPTPDGLIPGTGALLAAMQAATDVQPVICGKPSPRMYQIAMESLGSTPVTTLVVGDRPETDIAGAQELGCQSALVLSGVTTVEQARRWQPQPDILAANLEAVLHLLQASHD